MANKIIKAQMKQRRDTKANWAAQNPVLLAGELGIVSDDPNLYKVGDGTTAWNALPFRGFNGTLVHTTGDSETAAMSQKGVTEELAKLSAEIEEISENVNGAPSNYTIGYYLNADNTLTNDDNCGYTDYIPYTQGNDVLWRFADGFRPYYILFYREDKTFINGSVYQGRYYSDQNGRLVPSAGIKTYAPDAAFIRASFDLSYPEARVQVGDDVVWTPQEAQPGILEKVASLEDEVDEIKSELVEITGNAGEESHTSDKNRIGIFLEQTPKVTQYRLMVLCDNPPTESFSIYKARADHSDLVRIVATAYFGNWVIIDRDEEKPVLYIYETEVADSTTDARHYEVRYQSMTSLIQDVENLKNKDTNGASWKGKTIVCFGDSLTEFKDFANNKAYSDYIQDLTEAKVYNIGIGGSQLRQRKEPVDTPLNYNDAYAALDVVNMVKASCEQSFARQVAATNYLSANNLDRNDEIIALMQTINWNEVDIVTIMAGTNDWNNSSAWGSVSASNTDIGTTFGAINEIIRILLTTYPHLVIYWFTPTVRWLTDESGQRTDATFSDSYVNNGQTLREFSADIEKSVREHHIPVCDMYNTIGWNKYNFAQFFSDTDGVHPRIGKGTEQIAKKMIAFINANRTF